MWGGHTPSISTGGEFGKKLDEFRTRRPKRIIFIGFNLKCNDFLHHDYLVLFAYVLTS